MKNKDTILALQEDVEYNIPHQAVIASFEFMEKLGVSEVIPPNLIYWLWNMVSISVPFGFILFIGSWIS